MCVPNNHEIGKTKWPNGGTLWSIRLIVFIYHFRMSLKWTRKSVQMIMTIAISYTLHRFTKNARKITTHVDNANRMNAKILYNAGQDVAIVAVPITG